MDRVPGPTSCTEELDREESLRAMHVSDQKKMAMTGHDESGNRKDRAKAMNPERKDCAGKENINHRSHNKKSAGKVSHRGLKVLCAWTGALVHKTGKQRKTREGKLICELHVQEPTTMAKIKWETPPKQTGETRLSRDKVNPHQDKGACKPNSRADKKNGF
jgi:hypothetical protein